MSSLYNLEPQPTGKVVLKTTTGDILLELFAHQTPLACRSFLQHCLDGYYINTIFHRLVPGFIIQGGDPTGTGHGGQSALDGGEPFADEIHSRLKFNRRGLLGVANDGSGGNGSQFFLTLGATPELVGKHTMFGRVEGETIYNLMRMGEAEMVDVEGSERPLYPTKIVGAEILLNPFENMVARAQEAPRTRDESSKNGVKKRKKPAGKNVLSFGGDEGEEEMAAPVPKKVKANPKLVSVGAEDPERLNNTKMPEAPADRQRRPKKERAPSVEFQPEVLKPVKPSVLKQVLQDAESEDEEMERDAKAKSTLDETNAEIAALKASMKRSIDVAPKERPKNALEAMIPSTSTRGRKRGKLGDEKGAMDLFKSFKARLEDLPSAKPSSSTTDNDTHISPSLPLPDNITSAPTGPQAEEDDEAALCDLHFIANCQSCKSWDDNGGNLDADAEADGEDDAAWMAHTLSFAKDTLGKDLQWRKKMEEIEVIDPREKARAIKEDSRKGKGGKGREKGRA